jgi:hypothetical protein
VSGLAGWVILTSGDHLLPEASDQVSPCVGAVVGLATPAWQVPKFDSRPHAGGPAAVTDQRNNQHTPLALRNHWYRVVACFVQQGTASAYHRDAHDRNSAANAYFGTQGQVRALACRTLAGRADAQAVDEGTTDQADSANGLSYSREVAQTHVVLVSSKQGQLQQVRDLMD